MVYLEANIGAVSPDWSTRLEQVRIRALRAVSWHPSRCWRKMWLYAVRSRH